MLNGLRIMWYRSTTFGFLMGHTSTWTVRLINKMCNFGRQRIRCDSWEGASCTETYSVSHHLKSWTARANFLWRDREQWAQFKHVVQCFSASFPCNRFAITNSVVHAGWSQAAHNECCFGLSAWQFWFTCHLKPISSSFRMWTELTPE
jgi:hypothetical protein